MDKNSISLKKKYIYLQKNTSIIDRWEPFNLLSLVHISIKKVQLHNQYKQYISIGKINKAKVSK